jgi:dienelactone hydrolase
MRRHAKRLVLGAAIIVSACNGTTDPGDGGGQKNADPKAFAYDRSTGIDLKIVSTEPYGDMTFHRITYNSPKGGVVLGLLAVPSGKGPFAGIIAQHGLPGVADVMRPEMQTLARAGAVVIAIDAPFNRRSGQPITFTPQDSADQVQLMTDLQRAVDILQARTDVDSKRIGYFGYSYGAAMGALLAGIERRISTFVLAVGDGGLVAHSTGPDDTFANQAGFDRWLAAMNPIEPIRFVGNAAPATLYLQSGRFDELVPPADAVRLHEAASEPKTIQWYDAGHGLTAAARADRHNWFVQHLGIKPL